MNTKTKILSVAGLKKKIAYWRRKKKVIAFTNGCFDILHYGHISYLENAKKKDRILILGLNSDRSVRKLKGPGRPINTQNQRAAVLAALACIDYVTIFDEDTPKKLIGALKPDVMIKGADWKGKAVAGSDIVKQYGGKVEFIRFEKNFSTTRTIQRIKKNAKVK